MPDLPISGLPQAGQLDGSELFATVQGGITKYTTLDSIIYGPGSNYGLFAQTVNSTPITATTSELSLIGTGVGTLSVPANAWNIGDSFRADFGGLLSSKNNDTIRIRVKANSAILADSGVQVMSTATNDVWQFSINFTVRELGVAGVADMVTLGVFHTTKQSNGAPQGFAFNTVNTSSFDTTILNTLSVTAQFSSAAHENSIYTDIFILNKIY